MSTRIIKVSEGFEKLRLDVFLAQALTDAPSRTFIKKIIDAGGVQVNGRSAKGRYQVVPGDEIHIDIPEDSLPPDNIKPENIPIDIFYEDEDLIVVNKPTGMIVHPAQGCYTGTLVNALLYHAEKLSDYNTTMRPGIVHRLDQDTSGLMVVAKDNRTHARLARQFQKHVVKKRYVALVEGKIEFDEGKVEASLGRHSRYPEKKAVSFNNAAKEAITYYKVLQRHQQLSLVALFPLTGRTHQLRVHMTHIGHPILGDEKYGHKETFPRLALHAQSIGFIHPRTKQFIEFYSKIPGEFFVSLVS